MAGSSAAERIRTPPETDLLRVIREAISEATLRPEAEAVSELRAGVASVERKLGLAKARAIRWVEVARANQCLEPLAAITTPISVSEERFGSVPRAYVEATEDQVVPLSLQRSMQARLPCDPVFTIESDHVLPSSAPEELAKHLIEITNRVDRPSPQR